MSHVIYSYADSIEALCNRGLSRDHVVGGSMTEGSLQFLMGAQARRQKFEPIRVLHVGNFVGVSLCYVVAAAKQAHRDSLVVSIDPNLPHRNVHRPQEHVLWLLSRYRLTSNSLILTGYSLEKCMSNDGINFGFDPRLTFEQEHAPINQLPHLLSLCGAVFDLAIIDGNHDPDYLQREVAVLDALLKPDGMLALDDINPSWPQLQRVHQELRIKYLDFGTDGRIALLVKPGQQPVQNPIDSTGLPIGARRELETSSSVNGTKDGRTVEIVIAKYRENLQWIMHLQKLAPTFGLKIYDKSEAPIENAQVLPNLGREAHTYLHHIIKHYDHLADITVFCQGNPFDHCSDFLDRASRVKEEMIGHEWINYGPVIRNDGLGRPHHGTNDDGTQGIPITEVVQQLFPSIQRPPNYYYFPSGACFATTKRSIRQYPRKFFERMMSMGMEGWHCALHQKHSITWGENPAGKPGSWEMGLVFERLWAFIFCADHSRQIPWVFWAIKEGIL